MIRHLTAFQFDRRQKDAEGVGIVAWRQWKRATTSALTGDISHRNSGHHDDEKPKMIYTENGERMRVTPRVPRYAATHRQSMAEKAEKLRALAARITGREVVRVGYAPGSPNVDVWYEAHGALVHEASQDARLHNAAHRFAEQLAETFADPKQPMSVWPRAEADA